MRFVGGRYGRLKKVEGPVNEGAGIGYPELVGFAVGVMKINRHDLDWMTPAEYQHCIKAWNNQQEQNSKSAYELSRFNAWLCLTPNLKANTTVQDVCRFEWEELQLAKVHYGKTDTISKT